MTPSAEVPLDDERTVSVDFTRSRSYPAVGPSFSSPGEPAEGGEIEIQNVTDAVGLTYRLTDEEAQRVIDWLYGNAEDFE